MKKAHVIFGATGFVLAALIAAGFFAWGNYQREADFLRSTRPLILDFASFYNDAMEKEMGTQTYGEILDFSKSAIEKLNELSKRLLDLRSPNKSCDKVVSDMVGVLNLTKTYQSKRLQAVQYYLDLAKLEDQLEAARVQGQPVLELKQQYDNKKEALRQLNEKELSALSSQLVQQSALFFRGNERTFNYETKTILPAVNREEYLAEEEKKKYEQPLELPPKETGSERYVCLVDAIRAYGTLYNMGVVMDKQDSKTLTSNYFRFSIQQIDLAQKLMERSLLPGAENAKEENLEVKDAHLSLSKMMVKSFKDATDTMKAIMTKSMEAVDSDYGFKKLKNPSQSEIDKLVNANKKEAEADAKIMDEAWKQVFRSTIGISYIFTEVDDQGTRLALSPKEAEQLLLLIREQYGEEITNYEKGVIEQGDKYPGLRVGRFAGMLIIYQTLNEFLLGAKLKDQGVEIKNVTWEQIKELGLYRNGSPFDKYCLREAFYQHQPEDEKASDEEKEKKLEEFLASHPL
jgi:hypothetical protein